MRIAVIVANAQTTAQRLKPAPSKPSRIVTAIAMKEPAKIAAHQALFRAGRAPALGRGQSALRRHFSGLLGFAELYGFPKITFHLP